jgi:hypothetical protein
MWTSPEVTRGGLVPLRGQIGRRERFESQMTFLPPDYVSRSSYSDREEGRQDFRKKSLKADERTFIV